MIDVEKYNRILDDGLLLDHYNILLKMKNGEELPRKKRIQGFVNLLNKKGYILDGGLTPLALDLLVDHPKQVMALLPSRAISVIPKEEGFDFNKWVEEVHKKCQEKILLYTGKKQVRDTIKGKTWSFLDGPQTLSIFLARFIKTYKVKDYARIEKCMLEHIDECHRGRHWFPMMKYYIIKDGTGSDLMKDYEKDDSETSSDSKSLETFI
jgi:hypothetical protein